MSKVSISLSAWKKCKALPAGKWIFSKVVAWKAPYFGSINARFVELRPGYCELKVVKRRKVLNHIGTVHAIAMCNMAELAAGTMVDASIPHSTHRWIPKSMQVDYLLKAKTNLRAIAVLDPVPNFTGAQELPVRVNILNDADEIVVSAVIIMWVSEKPV